MHLKAEQRDKLLETNSTEMSFLLIYKKKILHCLFQKKKEARCKLRIYLTV